MTDASKIKTQYSIRSEAILTSREWIARKPLYLDTETTGLDSRAEICDIALINHEGQVLVNTLIKPTCEIPDDAIAIHGITNEMVRDAPSFDVLWPFLYNLMHNRTIIAYNAAFDFRLIWQSAFGGNNESVKTALSNGLEQCCAMLLYAEFYGDWNYSRQSYRWQGLDKAAAQCGIKPTGKAHRALVDAETTRRIVAYMHYQELEDEK